MVINLDDTIALTHNYVSTSNLADCLRFLREKQDQISGVRCRQEGVDEVRPETVYSVFVERLRPVLGESLLAHYVALSEETESEHEKNKKKAMSVMRVGPVKKLNKGKRKGDGEGEREIEGEIERESKKPSLSDAFANSHSTSSSASQSASLFTFGFSFDNDPETVS
jgi:hypothetical protein